jgi:hypothetical protein
MKRGSLVLSLNDVKVCKLYLLSSARDKYTAQIFFPLQNPVISLIKGETKKTRILSEFSPYPPASERHRSSITNHQITTQMCPPTTGRISNQGRGAKTVSGNKHITPPSPLYHDFFFPTSN